MITFIKLRKRAKSEKKLTTETWCGIYIEDTCYPFYYCYERLLNKKNMYGSLNFHQNKGYKIIQCGDIDFKEE